MSNGDCCGSGSLRGDPSGGRGPCRHGVDSSIAPFRVCSLGCRSRVSPEDSFFADAEFSNTSLDIMIRQRKKSKSLSKIPSKRGSRRGQGGGQGGERGTRQTPSSTPSRSGSRQGKKSLSSRQRQRVKEIRKRLDDAQAEADKAKSAPSPKSSSKQKKKAVRPKAPSATQDDDSGDESGSADDKWSEPTQPLDDAAFFSLMKKTRNKVTK